MTIPRNKNYPFHNPAAATATARVLRFQRNQFNQWNLVPVYVPRPRPRPRNRSRTNRRKPVEYMSLGEKVICTVHTYIWMDLTLSQQVELRRQKLVLQRERAMIVHREKKIAVLEQAIAEEENELLRNEQWPGMFTFRKDDRWPAREMKEEKEEKEKEKENVEETKKNYYYDYYYYDQDNYDDSWPE
ncbi:hypothetical protein T310_7814 [Rasamsonia emersonii CBS 393.64]|uniref:Uncharacterized protein n=1 Tax=Rasamsonia emersonii (strain ATCC 16479 / CBS 393.64 / IMI 116815) TaxID=1408163 RepID=A0A0F4YKX6_RASE3|nr:hypothetical protein T310_7814 [Rasamsonia emersonii CBS 393.64]KKA18238.1 hypothetical protein T310_7814 [Rasamsonia emersonii CBS 393.64]